MGPADAGKVDRFVTSHLRPTDQVFSVYEAYYPAKASASGVVLPAYIGEPFAPDAPSGAITPLERKRINVLILKPDCVERSLTFFGGEWQQVARYKADSSGRLTLLERLKLGSKPYDIIIYRRPAARSTRWVTAARPRPWPLSLATTHDPGPQRTPVQW